MNARTKRAQRLIGFSVLLLFSLWLRAQETNPPESPGPLSLAHAEKPGLKDCSVCHTPEYEVKPEKCLACHPEMALRMKDGRGFHRDKKQNCGTCHAEHRGEEKSLVPLEPETFNHSDTGFVLQGVHRTLEKCDPCHAGPNSFARKKTRSFLLKDSRCTGCHGTPHPGNQDACLSCHNFESWSVGGSRTEGRR